jgi:hypothetical protein
MRVGRGSELYRTEERKALERGWEISCFSQNFLTLVGLCGVPEFRQPDLEVLDDSQMFSCRRYFARKDFNNHNGLAQQPLLGLIAGSGLSWSCFF